MRLAARLLLALWLSATGALGLAADDLVAVPPLKARVTDLTGTLTREQAAGLEQNLAQFEMSRGSQIAILLVPTTKPEAIEAYAIRVAEAWKIGRKGIDDGIIVLVAKNDRKLRIEVGRGLEGAIPDAIAKRIVAEVIGPRFKDGDFHGGLQAGVAKIESIIGGEQLPPPKPSGSGRQAGGGWEDFAELAVVGIILATVFGGFLSRILGRLGGSTTAAGAVGGLAWLATGSSIIALIAVVLVFVFVLVLASSSTGGWSSGGWGGGGSWGGGSSDGGFSGGGGDFGGGGASGDW
jgi:uncharacterized protein